ncbi:hypothetical protein [Pseudaeromonas pectinilytica]|jgi:hypothetical protein
MKHHLVAVLPESLLSAPLDSEILSLLNLLSIQAILCDSPDSNSPASILLRLKNIQPFELLIPGIDTTGVPAYQLHSDQGSTDDLWLHPATKSHLDHGQLVLPEGLSELMFWLDSPQPLWISAPLAILPVVRAIMNIHPLDPYLATHYMRQLQPLLSQLSVESLTQIMDIKQQRKYVLDENLPIEISNYLKLEKKLHRQYLGH